MNKLVINVFYKQYVHFMVWLGAAPPKGYEYLLSKVEDIPKQPWWKRTLRTYKTLGWLLLILGLSWVIRSYTLILPKTSFPLNLKWQVDLGSSTYDHPTYQDGLVFFPANNTFSNHWYGIEAVTGQVAWSQWVKSGELRRCLTSEYLVVSGSVRGGPDELLVLKTRTGEIAWKGDRVRAETCSDSLVFTVGARRFIQAFELSTGQELWGGIRPQKNLGGLIYNPKIRALLGASDMSYVIDPYSGEIRRSFEPAVFVYDDYVIDQGELFFGETVLDLTTGRIIHKADLNSDAILPMVTANTVYIPDRTTGTIVALDRVTYATKRAGVAVLPSSAPSMELAGLIRRC